jgi:hypothetical protein
MNYVQSTVRTQRKRKRAWIKTQADGTTLQNRHLVDVVTQTVSDIKAKQFRQQVELIVDATRFIRDIANIVVEYTLDTSFGEQTWATNHEHAKKEHVSHKLFLSNGIEWSCYECACFGSREQCRREALSTISHMDLGPRVSALVDQHVPMDATQRQALCRRMVDYMSTLVTYVMLGNIAERPNEIEELLRVEATTMLTVIESIMTNGLNNAWNFDTLQSWTPLETRGPVWRNDPLPRSPLKDELVPLGNDLVYRDAYSEAHGCKEHKGFVCLPTKWMCTDCRTRGSPGRYCFGWGIHEKNDFAA